jgi:GH15 family glucan-1,4-alpha-glucosidase
VTRGRYLPIADYALIGDTRSAALVGRDGGIDWCCLPAFDSPSVFARILDDDRGGHFTVTVSGAEVTRRYLGDSMVLETTFRTPDGVAALTDAMPVAEAGGDWFEGPWILRLLRCVEGEVQASVRCTPAPFYAGERPPSQAGTDGFVVEHGLHASRRSLDEPDVSC